MIRLNINNRYPTFTEVFTHALNTLGSRTEEIAFYKDSTQIDLTDCHVYATFVTEGVLVAENIECNVTEDSTVILDLTSNNNVVLHPGSMLVEFRIADDTTEADLYPATALVAIVRKSIRDDAIIDTHSYGTVSEILREVAIARDTYETLNERLNAISAATSNVNAVAQSAHSAAATACTAANNALDAVEDFYTAVLKYTTLTTGTQTSAFVDNTDLGVLYHIEFSAISYDFTNLDENTQIRFSSLGEVEIRTKSGESWSAQDEWFMVANKDTYASLVNFLAVWNSTDYVSVVNLGTVSSTTAFNEAKYCAEMVKFNFTPSGQLAAALGTSYPCTLTYNSEYQIIEPIKRAVKIVRKVNSVAPTFSADNWEVIQ